jgi:hypothetical protein
MRPNRVVRDSPQRYREPGRLIHHKADFANAFSMVTAREKASSAKDTKATKTEAQRVFI